MSSNFIKNNLLIFAIFSPILFIGSGSFPFLGFSLFFLWLSILAFFSTQKKDADNYVWLIVNSLLALTLIFRTGPVIITFNILALLYSFCWQFFNKDKEIKYSFVNLIILPILLLLNLSRKGREYRIQLSELKNKTGDFFQKIKNKAKNEASQTESQNETKSSSVALQIVFGLVLTLVTLSFTIPLLASSNPIFARNIEGFFRFLSKIFNIFSLEGILHIFISIIFLIVLPYFFFALNGDKSVVKIKTTKIGKFGSLFFNIPKVALFLVLILFFISEIQLYFASSSPDTLRELNLGLGDLNREVFGRLSIVSFVIFAFTFFDRNDKKSNKITSLALLAQSFLLFLISAKTLFDYISDYSFTFTRYSGMISLIFVLGMLIIQFISALKNLNESRIIQMSLYFAYFVLLLVNILPYQFLILSFSNPETKEDKIFVYGEAGRNFDSYNFKKIYDEYEGIYKIEKALEQEQRFCENIMPEGSSRDEFLNECIKNPNKSTNSSYDHYDYNVVYNFEENQRRIFNLKEKYENFDLRNFNLAEFITYQQFKNVKIEKYTTSFNKDFSKKMDRNLTIPNSETYNTNINYIQYLRVENSATVEGDIVITDPNSSIYFGNDTTINGDVDLSKASNSTIKTLNGVTINGSLIIPTSIQMQAAYDFQVNEIVISEEDSGNGLVSFEDEPTISYIKRLNSDGIKDNEIDIVFSPDGSLENFNTLELETIPDQLPTPGNENSQEKRSQLIFTAPKFSIKSIEFRDADNLNLNNVKVEENINIPNGNLLIGKNTEIIGKINAKNIENEGN